MSTSPELIIAGATAIASAFSVIHLNRRRINEVRAWAWGRERDETDRLVTGDNRTLNEQIESIESKLAKNLMERRRDHADVEQEVRANRGYFSDSIENLVTTLNDQLDEGEIDVNKPVQPD